jgi:hypothetical protein
MNTVKPCPGRMHDWGHEGRGVLGDVCKRCHRPWGGFSAAVLPPPSPVAPSPVVNTSTSGGGGGTTGRPRNEALAARWRGLPGAAELPGAATPPDAPAETAEEAIQTAHLAKILAPYVADGVIAAERWLIACNWPTRGRLANDPDEAARKDLHECTEILLRRYLPNVTVGSWGKAMLAASLLYASMRIGAPLTPETQASLPATAPSAPSAPASTAAPATTLIQPSSPPPQSLPTSDAGIAPAAVNPSWG